MTRSFKDFYHPGRPVLSVEVFPPKTDKGFATLFDELARLKSLSPAFVSVTYGAMGSTRDLTRDLALGIHRELGMTTAFHFTCVGSGREAISDYVQTLAREGIELVVALRGDRPSGTAGFAPPPDGFGHANELVAYLKTLHPFSIAVAGYPEGHIEAVSLEADLAYLKLKVDSGADIVITQVFFDNGDYLSFVARARALGVTVPIVPGILPIRNLKQIEKLATLCRSRLPEELVARLRACGEDDAAMRAIGVAHATAQCRDLIARGAPGIHFYALNRSDSVLEIAWACKDFFRAVS